MEDTKSIWLLSEQCAARKKIEINYALTLLKNPNGNQKLEILLYIGASKKRLTI